MDIDEPRILNSDGWEVTLDKYYIDSIRENVQELLNNYELMAGLGRLVAYLVENRLCELTGDERFVSGQVRPGSHVLHDILEGKTLDDIARERKMTHKGVVGLCIDTLYMFFHKIDSAHYLHQTLLYLFQKNDELQAVNYSLQKQLTAVYHPSPDSVEPRILPGRFIQNNTRISWTILREKYDLILDRAIGWYEHYIHTLLQRNIMDFGTAICTVHDCISCTKDEIQERYSLSDEQINNMERLLNVNALTFNIPAEKVLLHFYYPYWAGLEFRHIKCSEKIRCCLYQIHVHSIGESMLTEEGSLAKIQGMGSASLKKLKDLLHALGFSLHFTPQKIRELYC
jgi:hypothetical protein